MKTTQRHNRNIEHANRKPHIGPITIMSLLKNPGRGWRLNQEINKKLARVVLALAMTSVDLIQSFLISSLCATNILYPSHIYLGKDYCRQTTKEREKCSLKKNSISTRGLEFPIMKGKCMKINGLVPEITITTVRAAYGWLSCMSPDPLDYQGQHYRTCEALFQVLRFDGFPDVQNEIRNCPSPMGAKMIARRERDLLNRAGIWDYAESDRTLMEQCLRLKLEQHPDLRQRLIETGDATIIEDCTTHDREAARIWGAVRVNGNWVGQNILGQIWMELRSELLA